MSEQFTIRERDVGVNRYQQLVIDGKAVSYVSTRHYDLRIGGCIVRMRGVDGVETNEGYRMHGYARRLMTDTIDDMQQADYDVSLLRGIPAAGRAWNCLRLY